MVDIEPHRRLPVHARGLPGHEGPGPARRPDHQQRLASRPTRRGPTRPPTRPTKHAITGLTSSTSLDGRAYDIACGQIDIGNAAHRMTERMTAGVPQADGRIAVEPRMDVQHVARAVLFMASLPLEANVPFLTLMATKMPFVGRG